MIEAEQTETMADWDKQWARGNTNGSMKKSNSEKEQTEGAVFVEQFSYLNSIYLKNTIDFNASKNVISQ